MKNFLRSLAAGTLFPVGIFSFFILAGCAHSGNLHPFRSQKGLLGPVANPDFLVPDPVSLSLYLGDVFNSRRDGGTVLYGHRLEEKLRKLMGGQVLEVCQTLPCYADAARKLHLSFILTATIRKDDEPSQSRGILTLTRWSVDPLFPEMTVPLVFPLANGRPSYERIVDRAVSSMMIRVEARSESKGKRSSSGMAADLRRLVAEGKVDQALRQAEAQFRRQSNQSLSREFYSTLYRLEMSAGKPEMAHTVGEAAIRNHHASTGLILRMAGDALRTGHVNQERNILYQGLTLYPDNRLFWRKLVVEYIYREDFAQAMKVIRMYVKRNPQPQDHPHFRGEIYACLVGLGRGDEADLWFRRHILKTRLGQARPRPYLAHAMISRDLQKGEWRAAEEKARGLVAMGVRSTSLYTDWMTALGASNNPIGEARVARDAISKGFGSRWIRDQLAYLEQKGY